MEGNGFLGIVQPQRTSRVDDVLKGGLKPLSAAEQQEFKQQAFGEQCHLQNQKQSRSRTESWSSADGDEDGGAATVSSGYTFAQVTPQSHCNPRASAAARRTLISPHPYHNTYPGTPETAPKAAAAAAAATVVPLNATAVGGGGSRGGWFERVPDHIWLIILQQMDNASQAAFAAVCRRFYLVFRSGAKVFTGVLNGLDRLQGLALPAMLDAAKAAWELHPGYNRLLLPATTAPAGRRWNASEPPAPWTLEELRGELDRVQIGVRSVEIYAVNRIGSSAAAAATPEKKTLPEGGETLDGVPLERACHRPSAPKGSKCITRLVVVAKAAWVKSGETLQQHIDTFPALRDLCLVSMCVATPELPDDDDGDGNGNNNGVGGGAGAAEEGGPVYGAAPASPGTVYRNASRRAAAKEAAEAKAKAKAEALKAGVGGKGLRTLQLVGSYGYRKMPELQALLAQSPQLKMLVCKEIEFDAAEVVGLAEACPKLERVCLLDCNQDGFMDNRGNARLAEQLEASLPDCKAEVEEKISNLFDMLNFGAMADQ